MHVIGDALQLFLGNQRAHFVWRIEAGAEFDFLGLGGDAFDDVVENVALDHKPRTGAAALAVVEEDGVGRAVDGGVEIAGVFENDVGRFAAEFEADFLKISGSGANDDLADFGRAGERDLVHVVMSGKRGAGCFAKAGDDIDDAFGQAGFEQKFAEAQAR